MGILESIKNASNIKQLNNEQLAKLSEELREKILATTKNNGGHLASNLGIIETTVALYKVFDFPQDKLIFDVGHQCYAHKILSGRADKFDSIRKDGGISGFPFREESEFDSFVGGHAGNSISAGIGYCLARDKQGEDYTVICVVGDASLSNGLNLEAITVNDVKPKNFIVILNDNGMSISKNMSGFYQFLSKGTTNKGYMSSKRVIKRIFGTSFVTRILIKFKDFIKRILGYKDFFENQGFKHVGVVDGNDIDELVKILNRVKLASKEKSVFLHVKTTKGKGFTEAEEHADRYHGVGALLKNEEGDFALALGEKLNQLIEKDDKVIAITAGMKDGTGLGIVEKANPKNFLDVGIAEEYAITSAGGMAAGGLKPFVGIYSTFLQRGYDQIVHDICLQNLPVVFCIDRAGFVGQDGCTHQGLFDLSYLLHIPNLTVFAPSNSLELKDILEHAKNLNRPVAIRYPKNGLDNRKTPSIEENAWEIIKDGDKISILAVGPRMVDLAIKVSERIEGVCVISARRVKPLCEKTLQEIENTLVITLEENSLIGGFGAFVSSYYLSKGKKVKMLSFGAKDEFSMHGSIENQLEKNQLTVDGVVESIKNMG